MVSNKYLLNLVIRLILIVFTSIIFTYYVLNSRYLIIIINFAILIIVQIVLLIGNIQKHYRRFEAYFDLIELNDQQLNIKESGKKEFGIINKKLTEFNKRITENISENQARTNFLESMLNHIDIALVCLNSNGQFELINNAAKKLFNMISPGLNKRYFDKNEFFDDLKKIKVSDKIIYNMGPQYENVKLIVSSFNFKIKNEEKRIIALQNIKNQLESFENESWQKLSHYLTHEIMNSVAPIISTTKGIQKLYLNRNFIESDTNKKEIEFIKDTFEGIEIIQERSEGLLKFIADYKDLFEIKKITVSKFDLVPFFEKITHVFESTVQQQNTSLTYKIVPKSLSIEADQVLLEQVLLNLIKNAVQAIAETKNPYIKIYGFLNAENRLQIDIIDNGIGIPEDNRDKIFIPFYSTKKDGSGIGLSLARYIMQLHGGQIKLTMSAGKTIFSLVF